MGMIEVITLMIHCTAGLLCRGPANYAGVRGGANFFFDIGSCLVLLELGPMDF